MKFSATEAGFKDGLGGASNSTSAEKRHYVLFGAQQDAQHPENSGVYFEYDDQSNGEVNSVKEVSIGGKSVVFKLKDGKSIEVNCDASTEQWAELKTAIRTVFPRELLAPPLRRGAKRG
jgi:hypothetical protein